MNMQAMLKQAQALQKDMLKAKEEVDSAEFEGESSLVKVTLKGTKEVVKVEINAESLDKDDIEALQEALNSYATVSALNSAVSAIQNQIDGIAGDVTTLQTSLGELQTTVSNMNTSFTDRMNVIESEINVVSIKAQDYEAITTPETNTIYMVTDVYQ